jgi:hypothetical protein
MNWLYVITTLLLATAIAIMTRRDKKEAKAQKRPDHEGSGSTPPDSR